MSAASAARSSAASLRFAARARRNSSASALGRVQVVLQRRDESRVRRRLLPPRLPAVDVTQRAVKTVEAAPAFSKHSVTPVQWLPIVCVEQRQPDRLARRRFEQVAYEHDVPQRLRHLGVVDVDETVVQPVTREGITAVRARALRNLVLVVRENQVVAAPVNIDRPPEMFSGHDRALDVPSRPAAAPTDCPSPANRPSTVSRARSRRAPLCKVRPRRARRPATDAGRDATGCP